MKILYVISLFVILPFMAGATPNVRKLGGANTFIGTEKAVEAKQDSSLDTQRAISVSQRKNINVQPAKVNRVYSDKVYTSSRFGFRKTKTKSEK